LRCQLEEQIHKRAKALAAILITAARISHPPRHMWPASRASVRKCRRIPLVKPSIYCSCILWHVLKWDALHRNQSATALANQPGAARKDRVVHILHGCIKIPRQTQRGLAAAGAMLIYWKAGGVACLNVAMNLGGTCQLDAAVVGAVAWKEEHTATGQTTSATGLYSADSVQSRCRASVHAAAYKLSPGRTHTCFESSQHAP
jgi:hypothetical protein